MICNQIPFKYNEHLIALCMEKNSLRNITQYLSNVGTYEQVGDNIILLK